MNDRLLGTRLYAAADDDRSQSFLVSDLHLPADGGAPLQALQRLLAAASASGAQARLLVLGDLFDSYVGPAQLRVGVWREVAAALAQTAAAGVSLTLLHGNRDFLLAGEFTAAARCRVVAGGLRCQLAGRRALLLHGDELCQRDLPYQRAKRWLRHPLTRFVARRLPLQVALRAAERARRQSRQVIRSGDQSRFDPTAVAMTAAFATGAELLVFGHIHRPARGRFGAGEYCILPAFDASGVFLRASGAALSFERAFADGAVDYPARTFR